METAKEEWSAVLNQVETEPGGLIAPSSLDRLHSLVFLGEKFTENVHVSLSRIFCILIVCSSIIYLNDQALSLFIDFLINV